ncbi:MAG: hypothetical protein KAH07_05725, partial [Flavobacteriaceae bacterium]|nr:hypothetical protein [Flavobacteriaceae bacterium]
MKKTIHLFFALNILFAFHSFASELTGNTATVNLTPSLNMKFALGGYGERMNKPAEAIHDRIWAKAIVLKEGNKKYAIITIDIVGLPPNI